MSISKSNSDYDVRLNRLVGQIEGIRKMINSRRSAESIGQQIIAAREALSKIGLIVLKDAITKSKNPSQTKNLIEQIFRI